jgi:hypothetical protein
MEKNGTPAGEEELMKDDRLAKLVGRKRGETVTVVVVEDENFYGNAHLLRRKAAVSDGQTAASDDGTTSKPGGED